MTPVNLGDLPSVQPIPTGLGQLKRGAWDGEGNVPAAGTLFYDPYSPMQITITTGVRPGWWVLRAEAIFRILDAAWYYFSWYIDMSPRDPTYNSPDYGHGRLHSAISWQHYAIDTAFRVNANTTYTAGIYWNGHQAGTIYNFYGGNYFYLGGEFIAEGSL